MSGKKKQKVKNVESQENVESKTDPEEVEMKEDIGNKEEVDETNSPTTLRPAQQSPSDNFNELTINNFENWLKANDLIDKLVEITAQDLWKKLKVKKLTKQSVKDLGRNSLKKKLDNGWIAGALYRWATESTEKGEYLFFFFCLGVS